MDDDIPQIPQNPSISWWFLLKVTQEAVEIKREIQRNCELNETLKKTVKQRRNTNKESNAAEPQLTQIKLVHNRHCSLTLFTTNQPQVTQLLKLATKRFSREVAAISSNIKHFPPTFLLPNHVK